MDRKGKAPKISLIVNPFSLFRAYGNSAAKTTAAKGSIFCVFRFAMDWVVRRRVRIKRAYDDFRFVEAPTASIRTNE
jgi:hypothetical protein